MEFGEEQGPPNAPESTSGGWAPKGGPAGALIEWAWAPRHLPLFETPAKIDFSTQKMGFVFANEF